MKLKALALSLLTITSLSSSAATLHGPDKEFIDAIAPYGLSQANWDHGQSAKLLMHNAYRLTHYMDVSTMGKKVHDLGKPTGLDLKKYQSWDLDGMFDLEIIARDRLNLGALVITKNGKLVDEYYWNGSNKDSTHLQMSITKSFTSLTAATLASEGKIDMSKPISFYLPELKSSGFSQATIQEVADMRSGIKINFSPGKIWDERMTNVQEWNGTNKYPELKSILDFGATINHDPKKPAGKYYDYQCANTEMLGMLVERVTGKKLADVIEEKLWSKVGFEHNAKFMSNSNGEIVGSGGLNATTRDVNRMMYVLVNDGKNSEGEQVISKAFINKLLEGNSDVDQAWANGKESKMAPDGWYKDQIRVFNIEGHKFIAFVGIHGQVTIGEPSTKTVISINGAQDQMQAPNQVMMMFFGLFPTILNAVNQ